MRRASFVLLIICLVSLAVNFYLGWQWQLDRQVLGSMVDVKESDFEAASIKNQSLAKTNLTIKQDLTEKDQEITKKVEELAAKQNELNTLSTDLETKAKELTAAQKRIDDQKSQLEANSSELSKLRNRPPLFSFQVKSSSIADAEAKKESVKQIVTDAYDTIESIYGKPYLLHSVTISFVDSFSNDKASGEIIITNSDKGLDYEIKIKDFDRNDFNDVNTIIHEIIHSYHGLSALDPTPFEEGITVAATDVVMKKMIASGKIPRFSPLYIRISDADYMNDMKNLSIPRSYDAFYGSDDVADFYQVLGKSWYRLYEAKGSFFSEFNEKIYAAKNSGQDITERFVLDAIKQVLPSADLSGAAWELK